MSYFPIEEVAMGAKADALAKQFEAKAQALRPLPEAARIAAPLLRGLRDFDTKLIPDAWCHA